MILEKNNENTICWCKLIINIILFTSIILILQQISRYYIYTYYAQKYNHSTSMEMLSGIIGFIVINIFFVIRMYKLNLVNKFSKLKYSMISTLSVALVSSIYLILALEQIRASYLILISYIQHRNITLRDYNITSIIIYISIIIYFIFIFLLFIKERIKYITFITKEIENIKNDGVGTVIKLEGNDEIYNLCKKINSMSLQLEQKLKNEKALIETKNTLITNVSHDLRTPLTSILGYIDLIKRKKFKNEEELEKFVDIIYKKSKGLNYLIRELFEYTKLTSNDFSLNYSECNLNSLLHQIVGEYSYIVQKENLNLFEELCEEQLIINLDIESMVRVLDNLISNAIKYSIKHSDIKVLLYRKDNKACISFSNKVNNFDKNDVEQIFERFYRIDKARCEEGSSGLGLSIAKAIVELHKGNIYANLDNETITFTVKLNLCNKME